LHFALGNALTDNLLPDLGLNTDDYNNVSSTAKIKASIHTHTSQGTTVQLLCFLAMEFPVQMLIKRYGFKQILSLMMMGYGLVGSGIHDQQNRFLHHSCSDWYGHHTWIYARRGADHLTGAFEGGFIPGTILFASYFYKSAELSVRLAAFWSTLNIARVISALLAAGILEMRGVHGRPGWCKLFDHRLSNIANNY
jgi:hypothetical protein